MHIHMQLHQVIVHKLFCNFIPQGTIKLGLPQEYSTIDSISRLTELSFLASHKCHFQYHFSDDYASF
jgi:hypothetical protein